MKIVITDGFAVNPGDLSWDIFKKFGQLEIYTDTPNELAAQRIGDADIAIINKTVIDEQLLQQCPNLKLICVAATGYNVVDLEATRKRNIPVCNVPGYGTAAVAQFTFSLLLELCNRLMGDRTPNCSQRTNSSLSGLGPAKPQISGPKKQKPESAIVIA